MSPATTIRGLYVIADTEVITIDLVTAVTEAIAGGAGVVQYRDKGNDHARRLREASALRELCQQKGIPFIVNDDVELAQLAGADGVHLGKNDATIESVRARLGKHSIIGISCYNELDCARHAVADGADYIAFGSFYSSAVKPDAVRASAALLTQARQEFLLPVVAIGGITPENGARLVAAGADALAVITGIFNAADIRSAAENYAAMFTH